MVMRSKRGAGFRGLAVLSLGLMQALCGAAQQPSAEDGSTLTLKAYSRLTVVDVLAYDAKEQPVHGLPQGAFTVLEDGKVQALRSFKENVSSTPQVTRELPKLPPHIYTNLQPAPNTSAVNILLIDALNTSVADQIFVKDEATRYLKSMPPGTRIAILGLTTRLRLLQGFTTDPEVLMAAVNTKKNRSLPSPFIDTGSADALDSMIDMADADAAANLQEFENEQSSAQADVRNRITMEALNQIAAYVATIRGRKNLIWFTSGTPLQIFPQGGVNDLAAMTDYSKELRHTADLLTAAQVAVYPVDAGGVTTNPAASVVHPVTGFASGRGDAMGRAIASNDMRTGQQHLSMEALAEATGGVAYYNTNGLKEAVGKAIANGSNFYTLSYVPPDQNFDGTYHRITVKVNVPGVHLSYRTGYYADDVAHNEIAPGMSLSTTAPEPYGNNMAASMARGVPTSTQLLFTVRAEQSGDGTVPAGTPVIGSLDPKLKGKPLRRYQFQYALPGRQIAFKDGPNKTHVGALEFDINAYDVYGKLVTGISQTINLTLPEDRYQLLQRRPFELMQALDLPAGELFVRVGVLDATVDKTGTLEIPLDVSLKGEPAGAAAAGAPTKP